MAELVGTMMLCVVGCGALIRGEGKENVTTYTSPQLTANGFNAPENGATMPQEETKRESVPTPSHVSGAI